MTDFPIITAAIQAHEEKRANDDIARRPEHAARLRDQYRDLGPKRVAEFLNAVATAEAALAAGEIPNVTFKDTKDTIGRRIEDAWKGAIVDPLILAPHYARRDDPSYRHMADDVNEVYYGHPTLHTLNAYIRKVSKITSDPALRVAAMAFLNEIKPLAVMFEQLKGMIVKRQPKPVEDVKAKYLAPRASGSATALVQKALVDLTNAAYDQIKAQFLSSFERDVIRYGEALQSARDAGQKRIPNPYDVFIKDKRIPDGQGQYIAQLVFDAHGLLSPKKDQLLDREATDQANMIRDQFVIKNLKKLDSIIDAKANFESVKEIGREIDMGRLTGVLLIKFTDGSSFVARNSVVWSQSVHGKQFTRFPLTFHDVVLPDGSKMGRPSEERMNTVFVGKGA